MQRIPLYDFDATAGMVGLFSENNVQYPINYLSIPDLPHVDGAIFVRGDSMYPLLKSGDIVVYKAVNSLL
ncbi:MAG: helix-turn-helix transcriptional regulator [Alistipes indistinctus]